MPGRLNIFQKTMLQWNDLHPYNAVHVVRISGGLDLARLTRAVNGTLRARGLAGLELDQQAGAFQFHGSNAACEISVVENLDAEITRQLNTAFVTVGKFAPFRFFAVPGATSFSLGLAYFHALADAESIIRLMQDFIAAYTQNTLDAGLAPLEHYPRPEGLLCHPGVLMKKFLALPSTIREMRRSFRPPCHDANNMTNGFLSFVLPREELSALIASAKNLGVTVNDILLATLLKSFSSVAEKRGAAGRRKNISVGCIVNTRRDCGADSQKVFGLFLGSFVVSHDVPDGMDLAMLAHDVHRRTSAVKRDRLYLAAQLEMILARMALSLFSTERRKKMYQKHYPLWGGVTNMNLNPLWNKSDGNYFRAVSTGPVTPLVLSVTTVGEVANVGVTYRTTSFSADDIARWKNIFCESLKWLTANA